MDALGFVAHTPPDDDPKRWQSMTAHTGNVADLAAGFASAFGAEELARWAAWLHDVGKYSDDFQRYLRQCDAAKHGSGSSPIAITAAQLTYADSERRVHYEGGVLAKSADFTATAKTADAYLLAHSETSTNQSVSGHSSALAGPGQLDHLVALGDVVVQDPNRRAEGQNLLYSAADDKFVLTGGPPSIFDAEQGRITGVSLTFFRRDDRVLVEGEASTPVVTETRVAR